MSKFRLISLKSLSKVCHFVMESWTLDTKYFITMQVEGKDSLMVSIQTWKQAGSIAV